MKRIIILALVLINCLLNYAQPSTTKVDIVDSLKQIRCDIEIIDYKLNSIERDKVNYQIEKQLLKDTFSSNIQILNVVIAIILAIFTIIGAFYGYFGFRNIREVQSNFKSEYEKMKNLRGSYERRFQGIVAREKEYIDRVHELETVAESQTDRIKYLELYSKIQTLIDNKAYNQAIQLIDAHIDTYDEYNLSASKDYALMQLGDYEQAVESMIRTFSIAKKNRHDSLFLNLYNILEFSLFSGKLNEYRDLKIENKNLLTFTTNNEYFDILEMYILNKSEEMKKLMLRFLESKSDYNLLPKWSFQDCIDYIDKNPEHPDYELFKKFVRVLQRKQTKKEFLSQNENYLRK